MKEGDSIFITDDNTIVLNPIFCICSQRINVVMFTHMLEPDLVHSIHSISRMYLAGKYNLKTHQSLRGCSKAALTFACKIDMP